MRAQRELTERLKLAIISHDPTRLPIMFPSFAPQKPDNSQAERAIETNAPVEIRTEVSSDEALDFFSRFDGQLGDLDVDGLSLGDL